MPVQKFPPPPQFAGPQFQQLNRWLIGIQAVLNSGGTIDPENVDGLVAAYAQLAQDTADIVTLIAEVATNTANIATNTANIATNTANIATNTANIATNTANIAMLMTRNQVLNGSGAPAGGLGNPGDLYLNNAGSPGTLLYGKIGSAWTALA